MTRRKKEKNTDARELVSSSISPKCWRLWSVYGRDETMVSSLIAHVCPSMEPKSHNDHARDQRIDVL